MLKLAKNQAKAKQTLNFHYLKNIPIFHPCYYSTIIENISKNDPKGKWVCFCEII